MFNPSTTHSGSPCRTSTISIGCNLTAAGTRDAAPVSSCAVDPDTPKHAASVAAEAGPAAEHEPSWHPDPTGRFEFRFHNGRAWTGDVSVDGNRFLDPLRRPDAGPDGPAGFTNVPFQRSSGTGNARAAFVLGLCSFLVAWVPFLCFLGMAGAIIALVFGIGFLRRERTERARQGQKDPRAPGHGYALAGVILAPLALLLSGVGIWLSMVAFDRVQAFTEVGNYATKDVSCNVDHSLATYTGTITNLSSSTRSYDITIEFLRSGTSVQLYLQNTAVGDVAPGATKTYVVNKVVNQPTLDCAIASVTGPLPFGQS
jgi:hypothetical protein